MKKKHRDIKIDGDNWAWKFNKSYYGGQSITIWCNRKKVFEKVYPYSREQKNYSIRPSLIARFIKKYLQKWKG